MKLLIDMNLSPRWVPLLMNAGYEAKHWSNCGPKDAPDSQIMTFAKAHGYVVLTHDLDFSAILAVTGGEKPSVVQLRSDDVNPDTIGSIVINALNQMADDLASGALLTVDPLRARLRMLPLSSG